MNKHALLLVVVAAFSMVTVSYGFETFECRKCASRESFPNWPGYCNTEENIYYLYSLPAVGGCTTETDDPWDECTESYNPYFCARTYGWDRPDCSEYTGDGIGYTTDYPPGLQPAAYCYSVNM